AALRRRRRQFERPAHAGGALLDARGQHRVLAAEQRVEVALRNLSARRDLKHAGAGKAAFAEHPECRLEHALADRLFGSAGFCAACRDHSLFTFHPIESLALVPGSTVHARVCYSRVPQSLPVVKGATPLTPLLPL